MAWQDKIPGCFGKVDQLFAVHPLDEQRAIKLLLAAKEEPVGLEEIVKAIRVYLAEKGVSGGHADRQIEVVRKLFGPWYGA